MTPDSLSQQLYSALTEAIEAGWSINRIAQEAGLTRTSIQQWYTGSRASLNLETVSALAAFLGMRLSKPRIPTQGPEAKEPQRKPKAKKAAKRRRPKG